MSKEIFIFVSKKQLSDLLTSEIPKALSLKNELEKTFLGLKMWDLHKTPKWRKYNTI